MTAEIEYHYKSNILNVSIQFIIKYKYNFSFLQFNILNQFGEKISIDLNKFEEVYGTRIKSIFRSKADEQQPNYWTLTRLNL